MKKLIIICEEKLRHYGDFLAQLISSSDDTDGQIVGLKDGVAAAQVWSEKEYMSNAAQISSEQYILFIGNSNFIKDKRMHMQKKYSEYGMNYGWLGKQGVLFVDSVVSYLEYEDFFNYLSNINSQGNQPEAIKLIEAKDIDEQSALIEDAEIVEIADEKVCKRKEQYPEGRVGKIMSMLTPLGENAKAVAKKTADFGTKQLNKISDDIAKAAKNKEIENQEYSCLVLLFYLKDLGTFLGLSEE